MQPIVDSMLEIVNNLESINVPYMVSGSIAMGFYTAGRSTYDIDLVVHLQMEDIDNLEEVFKGYYFYKPSVIEEVQRKGMFNIISNTSGFKVDFIVLKDDEYSKLAFENRILMTGFKKPVFVIQLNDLIIAKLKWIQQLYSERQLTDIENLILSNKPDFEYIKYWTKRMNLKTFNILSNE